MVSPLALIAAFLAAQGAAAAPALRIKRLEPIKIAQPHCYGFFPSLHWPSTSKLVVAFKLDEDGHCVESNHWGYVVSRNGNKSWGHRLTTGMVYNGEAACTREPLPDGRLFIVIRCGSDNLLYKGWSSDDDGTWPRPVSIGFKVVKPGPGVARISVDGAEAWSDPAVLFESRSKRYTDLLEVSPGTLLVVHNSVSFPYGEAPPGDPNAMNEIFGTFREITR